MQCKISRLHMMLLSVSAMPVRNLSQATTRKEGKGEGKNARTDDGGSNVEFETSRQSQSVGLLPTRRILLVRARILAKRAQEQGADARRGDGAAADDR